MITKMNYLSGALLFVLASCSSKGTASQQSHATQADTITTITLPAIPTMLTTPEQRAHFLVAHYWDNVNLADTNYIHHPEITEQAWVDYLDILPHVPLATAQAGITQLIERATVEKKLLIYLTDMAEKYLYDPNSPMRNEEFFIPVLQVMVATPTLSDTEKIRPQARLTLAYKNRVGTRALNFGYTLASGAQGTLHRLAAPYTLLFINNPGCHACGEAIQAINQAPTIQALLQAGKLKILALYPDEELDEWKRHRQEFPQEWINGYDKKLTIRDTNLYDLRAIPSLYLLGGDKTVLLKDATAEAVEGYLQIHGR